MGAGETAVKGGAVDASGAASEPSIDGRPPGVRAVARRAGVSVGTVSSVLNGRGGVSPTTRARVEQAMRELFYVPPRSAASRTRTIGLLAVDVFNPIFPLLTHVVSEAAIAAGYATVLYSTYPAQSGETHAQRERAGTYHLLDHGVTGMIFVGSTASDDASPHDHLTQLAALGARLVLVNGRNAALPIPHVGVDERVAGILATDHLVELGHRRIGVIGGVASFGHVRDRVDAVRSALHRHGLELDPACVLHPGWTDMDGHRAFQELLALPPERRPTGLVASSDLLTFGVIRAAVDAGLRVPQDLSIVGFDGIGASQFFIPRLTTVAQPVQEIAAATVNLLTNLLEDSAEPEPANLLFRPSLVVRESTAPPPQSA